MATIEPYETKAGTRYRVRYRKPDRRQTDKRGFTTKRDAKLFAATVETRKAEGLYIDPTRSRATVGELGKAWLRSMSHVRASSVRAYETALRIHVQPTFGATPVSTVTTTAVREWVADLTGRRGARTVRRAHYVLQAILETAAQDGIIPANPARGIKNLPALPQRKHRYLSYQDVERLAGCAPGYELMVRVAAYCGLRWGEIAALEADDVDLAGRRLHVRRTISGQGVDLPKNGEERTVAYPPFLHSALRELVLRSSGRLFPQAQPKNVDSWWAGAIKRANLVGLRFHDLRSSAASFAVSAGASVKVVQRMMGHRSAAQTLDVYAELFEQDLDDVAARIESARAEECGQSVVDGASGE